MHSIKIKKGNVLSDKHRKLPPPLAKGVFCVFVRRERENHIRNGSFVQVKEYLVNMAKS